MKPLETVDVYLDETADEPIKVGTLRPSFQGGRNLASSSFQYDESYLAYPARYELSPDLPLRSGRQFADESRTLFGAFADAAPDSWGRKIIQANHAIQLQADPSLPRAIGDFDYLTGVSDHTRAGALRLRSARDDRWLSTDDGVATVHDLDRIVQVARKYEANEATEEDIAYLNDVATSPGGARPKANVITPAGTLAIVKLPHSKDDTVDVESWEALALTLAARSGITASSWNRQPASENKSVLILDRFDRTADGKRIGYISAATAFGIGSEDQSRLTYEDFADTIDEISGNPRDDLHEMFRRIALTVMINNVDDHWRNHGFIRTRNGWGLSPVFDVNPSRLRRTITSRPISARDDPRDRQLTHLLDIADNFRLTRAQASGLIRIVADEVEKWPDIASALNIRQSEQEVMKLAFDNAQMAFAKTLTVDVPTPMPGNAALQQGSVIVRAHTRNGMPIAEHRRGSPNH